MADDRGSIERIDFVIKYPSGRTKHVTLSNDPEDNKHNHYSLAEIAGVYFGFDGSIGSIKEHLQSIERQEVMEKWNRVSKGDELKPAMVVLKADRSVQLLCGGHKNRHNQEPRSFAMGELDHTAAEVLIEDA